MKTNIFCTLLFFGLLFTTACVSKDEEPQPSDPDTGVNFSNLQEGQKSRYVRYTSKCDSLGQLFEYTRDTLILELIQRNDSLFFVESVTPRSPLFLDGSFVNPVEYPVTGFADRINIPQRFASALFFFYENDDLFLKPQHDTDLIQSDCRLLQDSEPFIGNDIGYLDRFEVGSIKITDKTAVSCEPLTEVDAYLIYDENKLLLSHVVVLEGFLGWEEERVFGWELLQ